MTHVAGSAVAVINGRLVVYASSDTLATDDVSCRVENMVEVKDYVRRRVPSAFIPSIWLLLSHLPLTISGKIDTLQLRGFVKALPANPEPVCDAPQDRHEWRVYECCMEVLGRPMSVTANLLDHGLDSYLAMALISRLMLAFPNFRISFCDLIANPVPRALAALTRGEPSSTETTDKSVARKKACSYQSCPASSMQARFCLAQEVYGDSSYNIPGFFEGRMLTPTAFEPE